MPNPCCHLIQGSSPGLTRYTSPEQVTHSGPHLSNERMAEKRAYDHFQANFVIYQFGRER